MVKLNSKHQATLDALFEKPTRPDIRWDDIEALVIALGGTVTPGKGSGRRIQLNGCFAVPHRPHPQPVTTRGAVRAMADFLRRAGVV
ncbi:type II toxin-antitoxin system HicA family toxin [Azospirillum sp. RWY-5-1]|uniref:Type II toxin-antitoxin system HicA family toxin n=1 Tax=Azospirillum oleiclasticum TaxID=2735135 RepID=A0ABX2TN07_9PROT|nr:type II toxin-antitoxin system HicA family toxin [Azospirillum oleiclasticum]NYZ17825.1 type II toxin-antitoxin system HicA family toxin [Azospirillum oleiclasticum]NYZ25043.1 type II toxin-antitoxin system HicA family toxin [Azospirillum oleiclasticum]